jgi:hypothetical protein
MSTRENTDPAVPPAPRRPLWRIPVDFWTRPIRAEPLALFRIVLGATVLASALFSVAPYLDLYLGPDGLCPGHALDRWLSRTGRVCLLRGPVSISGLQDRLPAEVAQAWARWGEQQSTVLVLFVVWLAALLFLTLGLFTRTAAVLAWVLTLTFQHRICWTMNGGDYVSRDALFYLMLAPAGAVWSLDSLLRKRRARRTVDGVGQAPDSNGREPVLIPPWSVRLIQIQLCAIYLFSGLAKITEEAWLNGDMLYWVLNDIELTRWPYHKFPVSMLLCRFLSWGTLVFENGFPFLVLFRRLRPWVLLAGVGFHLGIFLTTEIGWFGQVMVCWYAVFLSAEGLERFRQWLASLKNPLRAWLSRGGRPPG